MSNNVDPIEWVSDETVSVTAPNMIVFGTPSRGKAGILKAGILKDLDLRPRGRR